MEAGPAQPDHADYLLCRSAPVLWSDGGDLYGRYAGEQGDPDPVHERLCRDHGRADRAAAVSCGDIPERCEKRVSGKRRAAVAGIDPVQYVRVCPSAHHGRRPLWGRAGPL